MEETRLPQCFVSISVTPLASVMSIEGDRIVTEAQLRQASKQGHKAVMRLLLENKADVKLVFQDGGQRVELDIGR